MVGYIKDNFIVRYRAFDGWTHLNQLAEQWLATEADQRLRGTDKEIVAERFERERPLLQQLSAVRYDTAYYETCQISWDGYIDVRGNRYSVLGELVGWTVAVRIGLDDTLRIFAGESLVTTHRLQKASDGWVTVGEHHAQMWREALQVEQRSLAPYQEAATWSN